MSGKDFAKRLSDETHLSLSESQTYIDVITLYGDLNKAMTIYQVHGVMALIHYSNCIKFSIS